MAKKITPPGHLKPATARWWAAVHEEFELEQHHQKLLTLAAEAWDRACAAREVIDRDGMTFSDRFGQPKPRPEIAIERDSRIGFARLIRELALDGDTTPDRPPRTADYGSRR